MYSDYVWNAEILMKTEEQLLLFVKFTANDSIQLNEFLCVAIQMIWDLPLESTTRKAPGRAKNVEKIESHWKIEDLATNYHIYSQISNQKNLSQ